MAMHPGAIKNTFLSHFVMWGLFLPLLTIIFLPMFISDLNMDQQEIDMVANSGVNVEKINTTTNALYSAAFIRTGILPATEKFFTGDIGLASSTHQGSAEVTKFAGTWIRGVWVLIYKGMWRLNMLFSLFLLPLIVLCVPAVIDGVAARSKKKFSLENYNPVYFYSSMHVSVLMIGLFIYLPLLPLALTYNMLAFFLLALAFSMWITASNFQTGN